MGETLLDARAEFRLRLRHPGAERRPDLCSLQRAEDVKPVGQPFGTDIRSYVARKRSLYFLGRMHERIGYRLRNLRPGDRGDDEPCRRRSIVLAKQYAADSFEHLD